MHGIYILVLYKPNMNTYFDKENNIPFCLLGPIL